MMAMEHPKLKLLATKLNDGKNRSDDNRRGDIGLYLVTSTLTVATSCSGGVVRIEACSSDGRRSEK